MKFIELFATLLDVTLDRAARESQIVEHTTKYHIYEASRAVALAVQTQAAVDIAVEDESVGVSSVLHHAQYEEPAVNCI